MNQGKHKNTFDCFIVSKSNEFAYAVARAVAEAPGIKYNPACFYGPTGTGKTHLLNAIANDLRKDLGAGRVGIYSSEEFYLKIIQAIYNRKIEQLKEVLREKKAVLIEDIQFFKEKPNTQELLISILKDLTERKVQIVLTANVFTRGLGFIACLDEWLKGGIAADIGTPDIELRRAFITSAVMNNKIQVKDDVINWLSGLRVSDLRMLHGAVIRLGAISSMKGEVTLDMSREALKDIIREEA